MAEFEEKYIENEKSKFDGDAVQSDLSLDKLKIAQIIDRENRVKRAWNEEEDDAEDSNEGSDDEEQKPKKKEAAPRQTQRPNAQKFKDIMKADDAFPTLENQFTEDDDDLGETPTGEINS